MITWGEFLFWLLVIWLLVLVPLVLAYNGVAIAAYVEALLQRRRRRVCRRLRLR